MGLYEPLDTATVHAVKLSLGLIGQGENTDFDAMWDMIRSALREIHTKNASKISFEQLYRASYKIVTKKKGDLLYERVKDFEEQWFGSEVMPKIRKLITANLVSSSSGGASGATANERRLMGETFLRGFKESWEDHNVCMNLTTDVLMYMDRVYCADNRRPSIFTTAMGLFRDHVLRSKLVNTDSELTTFDIVNFVLLDQIQMERDGDIIDKNLIRSCVYMLEGLYETNEDIENQKLYLTGFEPEFLRASQQFYQKECDRLFQASDTSTWLRQTERRISEEVDRCRTTISQLTESKIAQVVETELISRHLKDFIAMEGSGLKAMIENERYDDLSLLYLNNARVDEKKRALKKALAGHIISLGTDINQTVANTNFANPAPKSVAEETTEKPKTPAINAAAQQTAAAIKWVDLVLQLKDRFDKIWTNCFQEDLKMRSTIDDSFADFINTFPRSSEYVSLFIDDNLKRGIKGKTEAEIDSVLDKATTLLRFIRDRDLFERYYRKHLARRLLHGRSESSEVEKQMIHRMKMEIGSYFTTKLEGMFKDMTLSEELTSGYRAHIESLGDQDSKAIELGVNVLTSNCWPMESMGGAASRDENGIRTDCLWPPEIKLLQDSFTKFYLKERNGRKLSWLGFVGSADLRCVFPRIPGKEGALGRERRYEITVPTYAMVVLLHFNDLDPGETLTLEDIQEKTAIAPADLHRILTILSVLPKTRVLIKDPATKSVKAGDRFSFNETFVSKSIRIKAPAITGTNKVEGDEERKDTESRNDATRAGVIEACIVRIMKQRKELTHQALFNEVLSQLASRFRPDLTMLKKRVEGLIEREYLERVDDAEKPAYRYLA
ncbi:MAG: Cullin-3 [Claussenomyces sp. TS43310]|nr:MAG: Cullin-3 [Claussenomyces sp. TS43310]